MGRPYVIGPNFGLPLEASVYPKNWKIADRKGEGFYIFETALIPLATVPPSAPPDCDAAFTIKGRQTEIDCFWEFFLAWSNNNAVLYRGIPTCHFCWANLKKGMLISEGRADVPTFTMGNEVPTRWLPATAIKQEGNDISIQCLDQFTKVDLANEHVPIGITVAIPVGQLKGPPLSWLNPGEIVVQGPLGPKQFQPCTLTWLAKGQIRYDPWPGLPLSNLFPQRPYEPANKQLILDWFASLKPWTSTRTV